MEGSGAGQKQNGAWNTKNSTIFPWTKFIVMRFYCSKVVQQTEDFFFSQFLQINIKCLLLNRQGHCKCSQILGPQLLDNALSYRLHWYTIFQQLQHNAKTKEIQWQSISNKNWLLDISQKTLKVKTNYSMPYDIKTITYKTLGS